MSREIRFRAFIPELGIMLNNVTLYGNGQMGVDEYEFKDALPKDNILDYDYECVVRNFINEEGDVGFEKLTPVMLGEDWIWIDEYNFKPMQFTGRQDKNGKEIYDGDLMQHTNPFDKPFVVKWNNENASFEFNDGCSGYLISDKSFEVIGNIYENKNLLSDATPTD